MLLDVTDGGTGFRVRLAGTAMVARCRHDATGKRSDEFLSGAALCYIISLVQEACRLRRPIYLEALHLLYGNGELLTKRVLLPLTRGDTDVTSASGIMQTDGRNRDGNRSDSTGCGDIGAINEDVARVGVIGEPPPEEGRRSVNGPAQEVKPGVV